MISTEPRFEIVTKNNIIYVNLCGIWTVQADLAYLTTLIEHIHNVKGNPWSMLVDMRGWDLPTHVFNSEFKAKTLLDRRNQKAESWVLDDLKQAEILMYHFKDTKLQPNRVLTMKEAVDWIEKAQNND